MIRIASLLRNRVTHTRSKRNHNHNNSLFGISPSVNNARGRGAFGLAITGFALASAGQGNIESMKFEKSQVISFPGPDCLNVTVLCDAGNLSRPGESDSSYEEAEEFIQCLHYYRQQLPWYRKQWSSKNQNPISANWPRNIPSMKETSALELDLKFCQRNPRSPQNDKKCQNLQFRIASCYIRSRDPKLQYRGYKLVKELAALGHPDGMCLYGIVLNEGRVSGVDANPEEAVVWFQRCVDAHRHIPSMYELAVALYTGEGVPENPERAVKYFEKAANLHVGAAYMLGECLLDGLGVQRRRAAALEWLIVAAELGHRGAQARVLAILETAAEEPGYGNDTESSYIGGQQNPRPRKMNLERRFTIGGGNTLERQLTIGGGSRNPKIKQRRSSIVKESREDGTS